jgi:leucyl aminopeptidase (aminopeptidase T)
MIFTSEKLNMDNKKMMDSILKKSLGREHFSKGIFQSKFKENSKIHLIGEGVDLRMTVYGKLAKSDKGEENMPGGEIFMAPIKESLNGFIKFDYPAIRDGKEVTDVFLRFKEGKVIESKASKNEDFLKQKN